MEATTGRCLEENLAASESQSGQRQPIRKNVLENRAALKRISLSALSLRSVPSRKLVACSSVRFRYQMEAERSNVRETRPLGSKGEEDTIENLQLKVQTLESKLKRAQDSVVRNRTRAKAAELSLRQAEESYARTLEREWKRRTRNATNWAMKTADTSMKQPREEVKEPSTPIQVIMRQHYADMKEQGAAKELMKRQHCAEIRALKIQHIQDTAAAIEALKKEHTKAMKDLKDSHNSSLDEIDFDRESEEISVSTTRSSKIWLTVFNDLENEIDRILS